MFNFSAPPPLSLYIHFPWCVQKCPYCDFNSHEVKSSINESAYITALINDLQQEIPQTWGRPVRSIFMGGGTPSLFSPESIDRLLSELRAILNLSPSIEITLEANPGTSDFEKFSEFKSAGINRLSIGIQSFEDEKLQKLGRIHDRKQAISAAEHAHNAGFENFNLDLMFALPGQTQQQAIEDINTAIDLEPTHISYYQLTIEPNTYFHKHPPVVPGDELAWEMQTQGIEKLSMANYLQYEVSAYSKPGYQCQHNLNYWQFGDYLGIGAGAHEKLTIAPEQKILRQWKVKHPGDYLEHNMTEKRISGSNFLSTDDACFEFMMNALRLNEGFETNLFQQHTGVPVEQVEAPLHLAEEKDWLIRDDNTIKTTAKGRQYLNELLQLFIKNTK
jgi:putative oxygen-independent coproporphyrinogen III oxidase